MFIALRFCNLPAPSGAECKSNVESTLRSAGAQSHRDIKAINIVLLWSTSLSPSSLMTFRAKPFGLLKNHSWKMRPCV